VVRQHHRWHSVPNRIHVGRPVIETVTLRWLSGTASALGSVSAHSSRAGTVSPSVIG